MAKPIEEPSLERFVRLKRVAEELKKTGIKESRKENLIENPEGKQASYGAGEKTPSPTALSDLIQEKMKLEKILQESNNLKSKICQRIELIKTIERREKELNQQLASVRKENDFSDQIKKELENLEENIK